MLALQGASIILVSTADTENGTHTPQRTIPCRAAENNVFILYANYVGQCFSDQQDLEFHGQRGVYAPDGSILVDFTDYTVHKHKNNYLKERRSELYASLLAARDSSSLT